MSSLQFTSQILMASAVLKLGIVKRLKPADLSWQQYFIQGALPSNIPLPQHAFGCRASSLLQLSQCATLHAALLHACMHANEGLSLFLTLPLQKLPP